MKHERRKTMTYVGPVDEELRQAIRRVFRTKWDNAYVDMDTTDYKHGSISLRVPEDLIDPFVELGFVVTGEN